MLQGRFVSSCLRLISSVVTQTIDCTAPAANKLCVILRSDAVPTLRLEVSHQSLTQVSHIFC